MKDVVFLPWECKLNGRIFDSRQRVIGQFFVPEQAIAAVERLNAAAVNGKNYEDPLPTSVPKGLYPSLVAWVEAKKGGGGLIREREKDLLKIAVEWIERK